MKCFNCNNVGHMSSVCTKERRQRSPTPGSNGRSVSRSNCVRVNSVKSMRVKAVDDCQQTPLAGVEIVTEHGKTFKCQVFPDTGSFQSIIAKDLVEKNGMYLDRNLRKNILAADGQYMNCSGSVNFTIRYEGEETLVQSLVSSESFLKYLSPMVL